MLSEASESSFVLNIINDEDNTVRATISKKTAEKNEEEVLCLSKQQVVGLLALIYADEESSFMVDGSTNGMMRYPDFSAIYVIKNESHLTSLIIPHDSMESVRLLLETACLLLPYE